MEEGKLNPFCDKEGNTYLHIAVKEQVDVSIVQALVKHYPELLEVSNHAGLTPRQLCALCQISV